MRTACFLGGAVIGLTLAIVIKQQVKKTNESERSNPES